MVLVSLFVVPFVFTLNPVPIICVRKKITLGFGINRFDHFHIVIGLVVIGLVVWGIQALMKRE